MKVKQQRPQKYATREYNRCKICGRPHAYIRKYGICRVCFRELAHKGEIPGVKKSSWQCLALNEKCEALRVLEISTCIGAPKTEFLEMGGDARRQKQQSASEPQKRSFWKEAEMQVHQNAVEAEMQGDRNNRAHRRKYAKLRIKKKEVSN